MENDTAEAIVRALAADVPTGWGGYSDEIECSFCLDWPPYPKKMDDPSWHGADCLWRRARELVDQLERDRGGRCHDEQQDEDRQQ